MKRITENPRPPEPGELYARYYDFTGLGELMRQNIQAAWRAGYDTHAREMKRKKRK